MWITRTLTLLYFFDMNYVYVIKSSVDEELYIGSTTDLKRRLREHNTKKIEFRAVFNNKVSVRDNSNISEVRFLEHGYFFCKKGWNKLVLC